MRDPEVASNIGLSRAPSLKATREWIEKSTNAGVWAYALHADGDYVGNVVFDQYDPWLQSVRLSVYIGPREARLKGIGRVGMRLALADLFHKSDVNKVWLSVHEGNRSAIRAYVALGFQVEGTMREAFRIDNQLVSALYMGLLRSDFILP